MVDTETKVVNSLLINVKKWKFKKENAVMMSGGSGNNWALGYFNNGPMLEDSVMEALRKESESCDNVRSLICFLSSGGGTGSGVGSYIIEKLGYFFPKKHIVCNLIIPFPKTESPAYLYNTVLSISKLYDSCDSIITFYNDFTYKQCMNLYKDSEFKFQELNNIIAKQLSTLFKSYGQTSFVPHYINNIVPSTSYKLISLKSYPFVKESSINLEPPILWNSLLNKLKALLVKNDNFSDNNEFERVFSESRQKSLTYYSSVGNMVICNGNCAGTAKHQATKYFKNDMH